MGDRPRSRIDRWCAAQRAPRSTAQRDPLHAVVYGTNEGSHSLPQPHAPLQVTLGDDPGSTKYTDPTAETFDDYLRSRGIS